MKNIQFPSTLHGLVELACKCLVLCHEDPKYIYVHNWTLEHPQFNKELILVNLYGCILAKEFNVTPEEYRKNSHMVSHAYRIRLVLEYIKDELHISAFDAFSEYEYSIIDKPSTLDYFFNSDNMESDNIHVFIGELLKYAEWLKQHNL